MSRITTIAAIGLHREIGRGNQLLWHIPDDLKRFKALTTGHPCIMGRKTFESIVAILGKPLPGRASIVVSRDAAYKGPTFVTAGSVEEAVEKAKLVSGSDDIFIIGGAQIYTAALAFCDRLLLTLIDDEAKDADVFFPEYTKEFSKIVSDESREHEGLRYRWVELSRS